MYQLSGAVVPEFPITTQQHYLWLGKGLTHLGYFPSNLFYRHILPFGLICHGDFECFVNTVSHASDDYTKKKKKYYTGTKQVLSRDI